MGCDIHIHQEVKIAGIWHHLGMPSVQRSYRLFTRMAGVREVEGIEPISQPRGLPEDITLLTKLDSTRDNYHSHSWLNAEEICILQDWIEEMHKDGWFNPNVTWMDWYDENFGYFFGNTWGGVHKFGEKPDFIEDIRWVFWFDN